MNDYPNEDWKPLVLDGYEINVKYEISNYGRVRSYAYSENGRILKGTKLEGYPAVRFRDKNGKMINRYVHRLVAEYFLDQPREGQRVILHLDYNKTNNYFMNLKWASIEEQIQHKMKGPNHRTGVITNSKLTEGQVRQIKKLLLNNRTRLKMIAKQFGITHTQLNRIRSGENWGHVTIDD